MRLFTLLTLGVLAPLAAAFGSTYYVDARSARAHDAGPGTRTRPWKSLAALETHSFRPDDTISFARGSEYAGGFIVKDSGTEKQPITFTSYGDGAAPSFTNVDYGRLSGNVIQVRGSHIVIEKLFFHDGAISPTTRNEDVLRIGDIYVVKGADHVTVRDCEFKNSPIGIHVAGQYALVTRNHLHDCTRFLAGAGWGPIAIMISNANNEFSHNRITNYIARGGRYGADGGAFEIDPRLYGDTIHDVNIHHNFSRGNQGFLEVAQAKDTISLAYNVSEDYQQFVIFYEGADCLVENNTVLRVLPKNSITDVVFTFHSGGTLIRNNIFVVNAGKKVFSANGTEVWKRDNYAGQMRMNNLYFSVDASQDDPIGLPAAPGEKVGNPLFVDYEKRDLHLKAGSPAIGAGVATSHRNDIDGVPLPARRTPDLGAYQFRK